MALKSLTKQLKWFLDGLRGFSLLKGDDMTAEQITEMGKR